jgi:hypothetical protein
MTEINGLRLAYRGFVAGLAGGYVWLAIAMVASLPAGGPMDPVLTLGSVGPDGARATAQEAFVLGLGLAQVGGAAVGMTFAYFFARFFTVRVTLGIAAICVAVLAWALLSNRLAVAIGADPWTFGTSVALVVATIGYGWVLGWSVPVRGEVARYSGSPST